MDNDTFAKKEKQPSEQTIATARRFIRFVKSEIRRTFPPAINDPISAVDALWHSLYSTLDEQLSQHNRGAMSLSWLKQHATTQVDTVVMKLQHAPLQLETQFEAHGRATEEAREREAGELKRFVRRWLEVVVKDNGGRGLTRAMRVERDVEKAYEAFVRARWDWVRFVAGVNEAARALGAKMNGVCLYRICVQHREKSMAGEYAHSEEEEQGEQETYMMKDVRIEQVEGGQENLHDGEHEGMPANKGQTESEQETYMMKDVWIEQVECGQANLHDGQQEGMQANKGQTESEQETYMMKDVWIEQVECGQESLHDGEQEGMQASKARTESEKEEDAAEEGEEMGPKRFACHHDVGVAGAPSSPSRVLFASSVATVDIALHERHTVGCEFVAHTLHFLTNDRHTVQEPLLSALDAACDEVAALGESFERGERCIHELIDAVTSAVRQVDARQLSEFDVYAHFVYGSDVRGERRKRELGAEGGEEGVELLTRVMRCMKEQKVSATEAGMFGKNLVRLCSRYRHRAQQEVAMSAAHELHQALNAGNGDEAKRMQKVRAVCETWGGLDVVTICAYLNAVDSLCMKTKRGRKRRREKRRGSESEGGDDEGMGLEAMGEELRMIAGVVSLKLERQLLLENGKQWLDMAAAAAVVAVPWEDEGAVVCLQRVGRVMRTAWSRREGGEVSREAMKLMTLAVDMRAKDVLQLLVQARRMVCATRVGVRELRVAMMDKTLAVRRRGARRWWRSCARE